MSCYRKTNGQIEDFSSSLKPCGAASDNGSSACCSAGDICVGNSICHYTAPSAGGSGYYLGGCTDPNFQNPACVQSCSDLPFQDIVFNFTSNLWECCGQQHTCNAPVSNETFQAISLTQLRPLATIGADAGTASATPVSEPVLGTGAAVGVAVACMILVLGGLGAMVWWIVVSKRRRKRVALQRQQPSHDWNTFNGFEEYRTWGTERSGSLRLRSEGGSWASELDSPDWKLRLNYPRVHLIQGREKVEMEG